MYLSVCGLLEAFYWLNYCWALFECVVYLMMSERRKHATTRIGNVKRELDELPDNNVYILKLINAASVENLRIIESTAS